MKSYRLAVLFTQPPFGSAISREGLDALLAATAFCDEEEIAICFWYDGVFNLSAQPQPELILQKDYLATFKLIELYDLSETFVCQQSLAERGLNAEQLSIKAVKMVEKSDLFDVLKRAEKVLTF